MCEPVRSSGYVNPKTCQIYVVSNRNKHSFSKEMIFSNYAISGLPRYVISKTPWDFIPAYRDYRSYFSDLNESIYGLFL